MRVPRAGENTVLTDKVATFLEALEDDPNLYRVGSGRRYYHTAADELLGRIEDQVAEEVFNQLEAERDRRALLCRLLVGLLSNPKRDGDDLVDAAVAYLEEVDRAVARHKEPTTFSTPGSIAISTFRQEDPAQ